MGEAISFAPELMFGSADQAAMIGWIILIFLPRLWRQLLFVPRRLIPFGLSLLYAGLASAHFFTITGGGYNSLDQVTTLLSKDEMLLAGWLQSTRSRPTSSQGQTFINRSKCCLEVSVKTALSSI